MSSVYLFLISLLTVPYFARFWLLGFCTYVCESTHDHDLAKTFLTFLRAQIVNNLILVRSDGLLP